MREDEERKKGSRAFWTSRVLVLCACVFLVYSFVATSDVATTVSPVSTKDELPHPTPRLVFMVIDAFRLSFLTAPDSPMEFTRSSFHSSSAEVYDAYARMPTVTLPRITALITGTLPSFGTILTNLATTEIKTDNWITRLKENGKNVHFFGDDTWIKLLPGQFDRAEGVTSFFVNDYTEVDNNVTRHLDEELSSNQWDALILHYLGLDHIGHSLGGTSPKIREKLIEMDGIIRKIHDELSKTDKETYLIVCGDHGMTAAGSHGGASTEETRVPVVIWNLSGKEKFKQGNREGKLERIEQIDISATIFDLFGLTLPPESYGVSLSRSFRIESEASRQKQYNHFKRLIEEKKLSVADFCKEEGCDWTDRFVQKTLDEWFREVQEELIGSASEVPNFSLAFCVLILILAAVLSSTVWIREAFWSNLALFSVNVICFASSLIEEEHEIWYFLTTTIIFLRGFQGLSRLKVDGYKEIAPTLLLAALHRVCFGFMQSNRRRWSMDQNLLPPAVFPEVYDFRVADLNTLFNNHPLANIALSSVVWLLFSTKSRPLIALPLISHILRLYGYARIDAYFLAFMRLSILPISYHSGSVSSGVMSLLLAIVPQSHLLLIFFVHRIGFISSKLNMLQAETAVLYMSSFYYTGNSNSLSTLSLTAGYVGLLDYYPILVGFQLFLYTFAGPIALLCGRSLSGRKEPCLSFNFTFRISCLVTSLVCLYIFQHHLFVWSVYTPKVVYDMAHVIFYSLASTLCI